MITVEGEKYQVVENLGYVHGRGQYAKIVETSLGDRVAVKYAGGLWKWADARVLPRGRVVGQSDPPERKETEK